MKTVFYDSIGSKLPTKDSFVKLLSENTDLTKTSAHFLRDGIAVQTFRSMLRDMDPADSMGFIWNGSELGCEMVVRFFEQYEIPHVYVEQGIMPQDQMLRLSHDPIHKEANLGITGVNVQQSFCFGQIRKFKKGKACVIAQVLHDSSLFKLKNPSKDFQSLVLGYLEQIEVTELVLCQHPKAPHPTFSGLPKYRLSSQTSAHECEDAEFVVGFNSTFLCEAACKGLGHEVRALDHNHILNSPKVNKNNISFFVDHAQFDPTSISFNLLKHRLSIL